MQDLCEGDIESAGFISHGGETAFRAISQKVYTLAGVGKASPMPTAAADRGVAKLPIAKVK